MKRMVALILSLVLVAVAGLAGKASAQSQAEFKRELKAGVILYKEPGLMEVTIKSMRGMMMMTGNVATDEQSKKAEEIIKGMRGVKEVRNRIRVGKVEECGTADDKTIMAKIDKEIENDEELTQARRKIDITSTSRNVVVKGELKDYSQAGSLINLIKRVPCINSLDYEKLEY
jgi:osmotically-inducible protein OsmY